MGDYIIELKNISKCYEGDTAAVDNVSLSVSYTHLTLPTT